MTITLRNNSGSAFSDGLINDISVKMATKSSVIPMPGIDKDVIQKFGKNNRAFNIKGIVTGSAGVSFLENAIKQTGSFYFYSNALNQVLIGTTTVYYSNFEWQDTGDRPLERKFSLTLIEII